MASCLAFAQYWVIDATNKLAGIPVGALWFVFGLVLTLFEAFVAFLQAYVFAILSTVYISMSYPEECSRTRVRLTTDNTNTLQFPRQLKKLTKFF